MSKKKNKKITGIVKVQVKAGMANPGPPLGTVLGPRGVNGGQFCQAFNDATKGMEKGLPIPVVITIYADRSFTFELKSPPAAVLLMKAAKVDKGSAVPHTEKVATVTKMQVQAIADLKRADLTAATPAAAFAIIAGTARSMGIDIEE